MKEQIEQEAASPVDAGELERRVEAVLMSIDRPMTAAQIGESLGLEGGKAVQEAVQRLNEFYDQSDRSFRVEQVAGGYQVLTLPRFHETLANLHKTKSDNKLSPAALETLAIVAYKQPMMRAQVETIRGVSCGEVLRSLMDRHLIKIVGRAEEVGRPMLYGTTKTFLEVFGLSALKDLPNAKELQKP